MGMIDPRAVFSDTREWKHPWKWAALHAMFMAMAGVAGVIAWGLNERVRERMRATSSSSGWVSPMRSLTCATGAA